MTTRDVTIDVSEIDGFVQDLEQLGEELAGEFMEEFLREMAVAFCRDVVKNTPVASGHLKGQWKIRPPQKTPGGDCEVTISNPVEYASYVEYGHRTRNGKGFVEGKRFQRNAEQHIKRAAPGMLQKRMDQVMGRALK